MASKNMFFMRLPLNPPVVQTIENRIEFIYTHYIKEFLEMSLWHFIFSVLYTHRNFVNLEKIRKIHSEQ